MAKKSGLKQLNPAILGFVQILQKHELGDWLWRITLDEPLYIVTGEKDELLELLPGTKLYLEPGQFIAWQRVGMADESDAWPRMPIVEQAGVDLAYEPNGQEEMPF